MIWITNASYLGEYKIEIQFNDTNKGIVNFESILDKPIFSPLKNVDYFKNFKLNAWTIEWENGADFSPEFLLSQLNK